METKQIRVFGHTEATVSVLIDVPVDAKLTESEIYALAKRQFKGIRSAAGNGGANQVLSVSGKHDTIAADEPVEFDDYMDEY